MSVHRNTKQGNLTILTFILFTVIPRSTATPRFRTINRRSRRGRNEGQPGTVEQRV